jgi:hypothetical protein
MLTNGNGKRRRGDFLGMSEVSTAPYTFAPRYGFLRSSATAKGYSSAVISPPATAGSACMNARAAASSGASKIAMPNVLSPDSEVRPARINSPVSIACLNRAKCRDSAASSSFVQFESE